jgi:hypothetical protein
VSREGRGAFRGIPARLTGAYYHSALNLFVPPVRRRAVLQGFLCAWGEIGRGVGWGSGFWGERGKSSAEGCSDEVRIAGGISRFETAEFSRDGGSRPVGGSADWAEGSDACEDRQAIEGHNSPWAGEGRGSAGYCLGYGREAACCSRSHGAKANGRLSRVGVGGAFCDAHRPVRQARHLGLSACGCR